MTANGVTYFKPTDNVEKDIEALINGARETEALSKARDALINYSGGPKKLFCLAGTVAIVALAIILGLAVHNLAFLGAVLVVVPLVCFFYISSVETGLNNKRIEERAVLLSKATQMTGYFNSARQTLIDKMHKGTNAKDFTEAEAKQRASAARKEDQITLNLAKQVTTICADRFYFREQVTQTVQAAFIKVINAAKEYHKTDAYESYIATKPEDTNYKLGIRPR